MPVLNKRAFKQVSSYEVQISTKACLIWITFALLLIKHIVGDTIASKITKWSDIPASYANSLINQCLQAYRPILPMLDQISKLQNQICVAWHFMAMQNWDSMINKTTSYAVSKRKSLYRKSWTWKIWWNTVMFIEFIPFERES